MYNYHKYLEQQVKQEKEVEHISKQIQTKLRHNRTKSQLADNYKAKVQSYARTVAVVPHKVHIYADPGSQWKLRQNDPSKLLADPQIYIKGFKTERDRVQAAQNENKFLADVTPSRSVSMHQFRNREPSKEIQPSLKFTASTGVQRVQDQLKLQTLSNVENETFKFNRKMFDIHTENLSIFEKRSYLSRELSKNLLPSLHVKTHFKGLEELSNKLKHSSSLFNSKIKLQAQTPSSNPEVSSALRTVTTTSVSESPLSGMSTVNNRKKFKVDPCQASKRALVLMKLVKQRDPAIHTLHKGEGKLFYQSHS